MKYLLDLDDGAAERFSEFLAAGAEGAYAGMVEVQVCRHCACVVVDLRHHLRHTHGETYSDAAWEVRYGR